MLAAARHQIQQIIEDDVGTLKIWSTTTGIGDLYLGHNQGQAASQAYLSQFLPRHQDSDGPGLPKIPGETAQKHQVPGQEAKTVIMLDLRVIASTKDKLQSGTGWVTHHPHHLCFETYSAIWPIWPVAGSVCWDFHCCDPRSASGPIPFACISPDLPSPWARRDWDWRSYRYRAGRECDCRGNWWEREFC